MAKVIWRATRPAPPIFTFKNFFEPHICPYANTCFKISSYIDLKCIIVCVTVKMQLGNTSTCKYSIMLALCPVPMLSCPSGPTYSKILDPPLISISNWKCPQYNK